MWILPIRGGSSCSCALLLLLIPHPPPVEADPFKYLYKILLLALSFSETGEFLLYLQECYLGRRISWLRSTWIYSFCVPHLPMFKHPPIPQWKEMLFRDQRKLVPRQKDLVRRVEVIPKDIGFKLLRVTFCLTARHGNWSSALSFLNGTAKA